ncbi:MAG: HPr(Ser) kinase/phosphatase [Christensenellales bacterium]|jgi:HPr kinase/phosphorylase
MISEKEFVKDLNLSVLLGSADGELPIDSSDINRPGLQLSGYWEYFAWNRPQLIGKGEMSYLNSLDEATRLQRLDTLFGYRPPCVIVCHNMQCVPGLVESATRHGVPVYTSSEDTTIVVIKIINYLNNRLAPSVTKHGVLVDVSGCGILITGESGVGKSEAALELVKRGHQLVADDVVDIRRVNSNRLVGEAPDMVRHLMEIRGVGIIDIATMYGIGSVLPSKSIDMIAHLEIWKEGKEYDRIGLQEEYGTILDVQLPKLTIPIRPGRNLAIVLEVAARNNKLKQSGFNAAEELMNRHKFRFTGDAEE